MKMALFRCDSCSTHAAENIYGVPAFNVNNLEQSRPSWRRQPDWMRR